MSVRIPDRFEWTLLLLILIAVSGSGCATPRTSTRGEAGLLPRPGATIELRAVTNASGQTFEVDVVKMLREAAQAALQEEGLATSAATAAAPFFLDLDITEYRPGNAFQRWLLPGWGSTVLGVRGALVDRQSAAPAAIINYERSVHFGGLYTVGAWSWIFSSVAEDITKDLKIKIERGGDFVVALAPRSEQGAAPPPSPDARKIKIGVVEDRRADTRRIGERTAAFGVGMGEVHLNRPVATVLREALADDLLYAGYRIVEAGEDLRVQGAVSKFWVRTDTTALYWDIVGEMELSLVVESAAPTVEPRQRAYACRAVERTYVWPSETLVGKALDACLADMMTRLRTDQVWK